MTVSQTEGDKYGWTRIQVQVGWALMLLFIAVRILRLMANRSLWMDEALLGFNIADRSLAGLLGPLAMNQGAPVGYLLLVKSSVMSFGLSEYSLRLPALLAGCLNVLLFFRFVRRHCGGLPGLIGLTLFGASESMIFFSAETKPYAFDVTAMLTVLSMMEILMADNVSGRHAAWAAFLGAVLPFFSFPAVFILGGVGAAAIGRQVVNRKWGSAWRVSGICMVWALSLVTDYLVFLRHLASNNVLRDDWTVAFAPLLPRSLNDFMWYAEAALRNCKDLFGTYATFDLPEFGQLFAGLVLAWVGTGLLVTWSKNRWSCAALVAPIILALIASGLHRYPFKGRFLLFYIPCLVFAVTQGLEASRQARHQAVTIVSGSVLALAVLVPAGLRVFRPPGLWNVRPALAWVQEHSQRGEILVVYPQESSIEMPMRFYREKMKLFPLQGVDLECGSTADWPDYRSLLAKVTGRARVWVMFDQYGQTVKTAHQPAIESLLSRQGKQLYRHDFDGVSLELYDLSTEGEAAVSHD